MHMNINIDILYIHVTYPEHAILKLPPGPDRMWVSHRLTVEYSTLTLVLILTALVACDLRSS